MDFKTALHENTEFVNDIVLEGLPVKEELKEKIIESVRYSVEAGGKRIRPMLILESFKLCGGKDISIVKPYMQAIEYIHTYSLVHDDLPAMDNDDYRRGRLTTHKKFGEDFGVLAGDALLNYAFETVANGICAAIDRGLAADTLVRMNRALSVLGRKAGIYGMVGGQALDVMLTGSSIDEEQLKFIFDNKTGALIEASFMIGAILAGADAKTVDMIERAGNLVGVAFQIQDDCLDVIGDEAQLGKPLHSDEKNNKTTYVTLYGLDKAREDVEAMSNQAIDIINSVGNNEYLVELVRMLINRSK